LPAIIWDLIEGGQKGQTIALSVKSLINGFFALGIENIYNECNNVSLKYRALWAPRPSTDLMSEYNLPITYKEGSKELESEFKLFEPSSIRIRIIDSLYQENAQVPAMIEHSLINPTNPLLTIYLKSMEVIDSKITWKGSSISLQSIINHELLHACGDSPILRSEIHDGVLRHTMVCNEAINNLISRKIGVSRQNEIN
jgi:hypothetical protein